MFGNEQSAACESHETTNVQQSYFPCVQMFASKGVSLNPVCVSSVSAEVFVETIVVERCGMILVCPLPTVARVCCAARPSVDFVLLRFHAGARGLTSKRTSKRSIFFPRFGLVCEETQDF